MEPKAFVYSPRRSLKIMCIQSLPQIVYVQVNSVNDCIDAIRKMKVKGGQVISTVAALSLVVEMEKRKFSSTQELHEFITESIVRCFEAGKSYAIMKITVARIQTLADRLLTEDKTLQVSYERIISMIESLVKESIDKNKMISEKGARHILEKASAQSLVVMTHSNTGHLTTCGYGTALGVIRYLAEMGKLSHVYFTETRPYNQGSTETAYELLYEKLPATLIVDSAASLTIKTKNIKAVIIGARTVAANGDVVSEVGSFQLALTAKFHSVPFYVCASTDTIDLSLANGKEIATEDRPSSELFFCKGEQICPKGLNGWNPAFDITPAPLVTGGIITEKGVLFPEDNNEGDLQLRDIGKSTKIIHNGHSGTFQGLTCQASV